MLKNSFLYHMQETSRSWVEMSRFLDILKQLIRTPSVVVRNTVFSLFKGHCECAKS